MVFERKVKSKKREYWVLIHPIRKGARIIQKSRYIGRALPPKARLEQLKREFLSDMQVGRYRFFSAKDVEEIEKKRAEYKEEIGRLSPLGKEERLKEFIIRFTYDSSKLSGVAVTLRQTSLILREGLIPKGFKNLRTAKELENHEKCMIAITKYRGKLDMKFVEKMHKVLFAGIDDSIAGRPRDELKRNVKIAGTSYVPPKWENIRKEMEMFFKWYSSESRRMHPLELASLVHLKIISIQPFADGNSRLSRLLMNWILWKKGYPLVDIPIEELEDYYNVLDKYQVEKKEKSFVDYIKKRYLKS